MVVLLMCVSINTVVILKLFLDIKMMSQYLYTFTT